MELVVQKIQHQTYNPRDWIQLPSKFWSVVKFLDNLTNLLSHNLGKTQTEIPQHFKANCCLKVHNAHLKLVSQNICHRTKTQNI